MGVGARVGRGHGAHISPSGYWDIHSCWSTRLVRNMFSEVSQAMFIFCIIRSYDKWNLIPFKVYIKD